MTEQQHHIGARGRILLAVIALAAVGVGSWLYKRQPVAEVPVQAPLHVPDAVASAAASPTPAAAASMAGPVPSAPAVRPADAVSARASEAAAAAMEKWRSPAEALRKV